MLKTKLKKYLKQKGLNYTHERRVLINLLNNNFTDKKFSVKDIQQALKKHHGYINNSTIYRSLKLFSAAEVIECISEYENSSQNDSKTKYYQVIIEDYNANINCSIVLGDTPIKKQLDNPLLNKIIKKVCIEHNLPYDNIQVSIAASNNN